MPGDVSAAYVLVDDVSRRYAMVMCVVRSQHSVVRHGYACTVSDMTWVLLVGDGTTHNHRVLQTTNAYQEITIAYR